MSVVYTEQTSHVCGNWMERAPFHPPSPSSSPLSIPTLVLASNILPHYSLCTLFKLTSKIIQRGLPTNSHWQSIYKTCIFHPEVTVPICLVPMDLDVKTKAVMLGACFLIVSMKCCVVFVDIAVGFCVTRAKKIQYRYKTLLNIQYNLVRIFKSDDLVPNRENRSRDLCHYIEDSVR